MSDGADPSRGRAGARVLAAMAGLAGLAASPPAWAATVVVAPDGGAGCRAALVRLLETDPALRAVEPAGTGKLAWPVGAAEARDLAERAAGDLVVVQRPVATGPGAPRLEVELRSGHSGAAIERLSLAYDASAAAGADCEGAALALHQAVRRALAEPAAVAAPADDPPLAGLGVGGLPGDEPISIESEELEVTRRADQSRHLVFRQNVRVRQGDVTLRSDRLEAFYPEGASEPERMLAEGAVEVRQAGRLATCQRALYRRATRSVQCTGSAELLDGCDRVRGSSIELDLARETVRVEGAASVWIGAREAGAPAHCGGGEG